MKERKLQSFLVNVLDPLSLLLPDSSDNCTTYTVCGVRTALLSLENCKKF
jgi:hypothetical protein